MIDQHARRVRKVRLSAPDEAMVRRGAIVLEDALHTASLPAADSGRLLIVRSFSVGKIGSNQSPSSLALAIENRFHLLDSSAIHAEDPAANSHTAVYFRDSTEPYIRLAVRLAQQAKTDAWFWPLAVPCWRPAMAKDDAFRNLLYGVIATPAGAMAAVVMLREVHASGSAESLLSSLKWEDGPRLLCAFGWSKPVLPAALIEAPVASPVEEALLKDWSSALRSISRWGADDDRAIWLAAAILVAENSARMLDRRLVSRAQRLVKLVESRQKQLPSHQQIRRRTRHTLNLTDSITRPAGETRAQEVRPQTRPEVLNESDSAAAQASTSLSHESAAHVDQAIDEQQPKTQSRIHPWTDSPQPTDYAGLFFLLPVMSRLNIAGALEANPDLIELNLPHRLLRYVGERVGIPDDDPVMWPLAVTNDEATADVIIQLKGWLSAIRRWTRRCGRIGIVELVRRRGRIVSTPTHIDIIFSLRQTDIRIRKAGLDVDPGWVPWFGRVIQFHYTNGEHSDAEQ